MKHDRFLKKLAALGIRVEVKAKGLGLTDFYLFINDVQASKDDYSVFGYYCGGAYATCNRNTKEDFTASDLEYAVKRAIEILDREIRTQRLEIDFFDVCAFLKTYGQTKIDREACTRVLHALEENFQKIEKN